MTEALALRVAARYQRHAREFGSPEALRDYLHEHPQADKSKHTVVKKDHDDHGDDHGGEHKEEPKKSWKERLKGLSEKASNFIKNAPKTVHKFIEDESFRKKTAQDAHKALVETPEKFAKKALTAAKEEVKEFKEAGHGIAALMKGKKMTGHQKKALKTVATHMAISVAAAAMTASGPLAAAGMVGKALVKHVALKSVSNLLGKAHVLEELGHIGHGVHHLLDKLAAEKKDDPEEVLMNLIAAAVAKELEGGISDADLKEAFAAMEDEEDEGKKAASWKVAAEPADTLRDALGVHGEILHWAGHFPNVLRLAQQEAEGLPEGWVWQDRFVKFFQAYEPLEAQLGVIEEKLLTIATDRGPMSDIANDARSTTEPPSKARVSDAIKDFQFFKHPSTNRDHIAYNASTLKEWGGAFGKWATETHRTLQRLLNQASRI